MFEILDKARQFAKEAKQYIKSIVGSDNEKKPADKSAKNDSPNSVHNPQNKTVDKPGDKFEKQTVKKAKQTVTTENKSQNQLKQNNPQQKSNNVTADDVVKVGKEIDKLKTQYSISDDEFYNIILKKAGYSRKQYMQLNNNQKMEVLLTVRGAMKLFSRDKYINSPDINSAELIASALEDFELAKSIGKIKNIEEFDKATSKYIIKINKEFNEAKTHDEKFEVLIKNRLAFEADIKKQRDAELKLCKTNAQRDAVNKKYDAREKSFEGYFQSKFIAQNGKPENAFLSTNLRKADDMVNGYERAVKSFSSQAKSCAAGTFTHGNRIKQAQRYAELGDPISATTYGAATEVVTQYMSKVDLETYEKDAYAFKKEYYKNPEKYLFITEEHLTKESVGIAMGAAINSNLTTTEKAEFLKTWNKHAEEFFDYNQVRKQFYTELKQYMEKHPETKQAIENLKKRYQECYGVTPELPYSAKKRYESEVGATNIINQKNAAENTVSVAKASPQKLEQALASKSFDEVRTQYSKNTDREFAEVILHNPKLKNHRPNIVNYLKILSPNDLNNMIKGCSTDTFLFVLRNITPDKAGRLYDLSKSDKCYDARKLGKEIIEEGNENAVA